MIKRTTAFAISAISLAVLPAPAVGVTNIAGGDLTRGSFEDVRELIKQLPEGETADFNYTGGGAKGRLQVEAGSAGLEYLESVRNSGLINVKNDQFTRVYEETSEAETTRLRGATQNSNSILGPAEPKVMSSASADAIIRTRAALAELPVCMNRAGCKTRIQFGNRYPGIAQRGSYSITPSSGSYKLHASFTGVGPSSYGYLYRSFGEGKKGRFKPDHVSEWDQKIFNNGMVGANHNYFYKTTLPGHYRDTRASDGHEYLDFTIGSAFPWHLSPSKTYTVDVVTPPPTVSSPPAFSSIEIGWQTLVNDGGDNPISALPDAGCVVPVKITSTGHMPLEYPSSDGSFDGSWCGNTGFLGDAPGPVQAASRSITNPDYPLRFGTGGTNCSWNWATTDKYC